MDENAEFTFKVGDATCKAKLTVEGKLLRPRFVCDIRSHWVALCSVIINILCRNTFVAKATKQSNDCATFNSRGHI